jgi:hypothetical protein
MKKLTLSYGIIGAAALFLSATPVIVAYGQQTTHIGPPYNDMNEATKAYIIDYITNYIANNLTEFNISIDPVTGAMDLLNSDNSIYVIIDSSDFTAENGYTFGPDTLTAANGTQVLPRG